MKDVFERDQMRCVKERIQLKESWEMGMWFCMIGRMNHSIIHSPFTLQTLKNHQILSFNQSIPDYQQIIYRLLLNPSPYLQHQLNQFKKQHFIRKHVVGIQIRMGGCLANYQEIC